MTRRHGAVTALGSTSAVLHETTKFYQSTGKASFNMYTESHNALVPEPEVTAASVITVVVAGLLCVIELPKGAQAAHADSIII